MPQSHTAPDPNKKSKVPPPPPPPPLTQPNHTPYPARPVPALQVSAQGFLKLPLAELAGNGGGQNLNQYTLQFAVCQQGQHWSGSVLLKNDHGLTVRIRHGMLTVDGLGWEGTSVWDKKEDVEWSYKKHGKWLPFSMAQTMELEKVLRGTCPSDRCAHDRPHRGGWEGKGTCRGGRL